MTDANRDYAEDWQRRPKEPCRECGGPTGWAAGDPRASGICLSCKTAACGTSHGYRTRKCRCDKCRSWASTAAREYRKAYRAKYGKDVTYNVKARRRARERAAFVADVDRVQIFEADGYRCHLRLPGCKGKTDPTKSFPHPNSPTIDHIVPLAAGGTHEPTNCRTACLRCNTAKRHNGGGEQLLLLN